MLTGGLAALFGPRGGLLASALLLIAAAAGVAALYRHRTRNTHHLHPASEG